MPKLRCSLKSCRVYFDREAGITNGVQSWCSEDHQHQAAMDALGRLRTAKQKEVKAKSKAFKDGHVPTQKALTQQAFNRMIRAIDAKLGCISCDKPATWGGQWHAGHWLSVGSHGMLRLDARNCHKQCSVCNAHLSGNVAKYREGLIARYGESLVAYLEGPHATIKWEAVALQRLRAVFSAEARRIESGQPPSRDWRSLDYTLSDIGGLSEAR